MFLNYFPPKTRLLESYIPRTIMKGKYLDLNKICKLHFGAYAQVHKDRNITNTLEEIIQGAI